MRLAPEIVAGMQQLALEQRRLLGQRAPWHVGDLAWGLRQHEGRESEWKIRLWVEDGRTVAWSWLKQDGPDILEHDVHPNHLNLLDEILAETTTSPSASRSIARSGRPHGLPSPAMRKCGRNGPTAPHSTASSRRRMRA